jgi:NAD(P)H-dependent FMN reductase
MLHIALISSSVRTGRNSHRVTLFLDRYLRENNIATTEILDLNEYQFPLFEERLHKMKDPPAKVLDFAEHIKRADGILVITPEYNGGYPASLKNVIDLLYPEWKHKPTAISTVSDGAFAGSQVAQSLSFVFLKIGALVSPAMFRIPTVHKEFEEDGTPVDPVATNRRAKLFIDEFVWFLEAKRRMKE